MTEGLRDPVDLLVDIGCGTGQLLDLLLRAGVCRRAVGLDPAPGMLALAEARLAPHGDRVRLAADSAEAIDLPAGAADAVMGVDVIHHLDDPPQALAEARRILRPDGRAVFLESNVRFPSTFVIGISSREEHGMFRTSRGFLTSLLEHAGFENVTVDHPPLFTPPGPNPLVPIYDRIDAALARIPGIRGCAIFYRVTGETTGLATS